MGECIESMISGRIMYAELRPTFMRKSILMNDGSTEILVGNQMGINTSGTENIGNSNLYNAVLLKAKRVGHEYSLPRHPKLMGQFAGNLGKFRKMMAKILGKGYAEHKICIELCSISNELLHLCRIIKGHVFPQWLAAGIPCTLNTDNFAFFG